MGEGQPLQQPISLASRTRAPRLVAAVGLGIVLAFVAGGLSVFFLTQPQATLRQATLSMRLHTSTTGHYQIYMNGELEDSGLAPFAGGTLLTTRTLTWWSSRECDTFVIEVRLIPFEGPLITSSSSERICAGDSKVLDFDL